MPRKKTKQVQPKFTNPQDIQYIKESKPFKFRKDKFSEHNLVGVFKYQRLLNIAYEPHIAKQLYERKLQSLLKFKQLATAQKSLDFEIELLERVVDQQPNEPIIDEEEIEEQLFDYALKAFEERLG